MERLFWICLAGAGGMGARYVIALWAAQRLGSAFPFDTLVVNLAGFFAIAAIMEVTLTLSWLATLPSVITIGFIGGPATYSSFNDETSRLLEQGAPGVAAINAVATTVGAFCAGCLGTLRARYFLR